MSTVAQITIQDKLEAIVDADGLAVTLGTLVDVCTLKAEHLESVWQSDDAETWKRAGKAIDKACRSCHVQRLAAAYGHEGST